jgi:hypothetical protein
LKGLVAYLQGDGFTTATQMAFGVSKPTYLQRRVASSIVRCIHQDMLMRLCTPSDVETPEVPDPRIAHLHEHGPAAGKVRYVGESVIGRLIHRIRQRVRTALESTSTGVLPGLRLELSVLNSMVVGENATSKFPHTTSYTDAKAYGRLTYISDECYLFFLKLEEKRLLLSTTKTLSSLGGHFPGYVVGQLQMDEELQQLFSDALPEEEVSPCASEVRRKMINLYMKTGNKEFKRQVLRGEQTKKRQTLRRSVCHSQPNQGKKKNVKKVKNVKKKKYVKPAEDSDDDDDNYCHQCGQPYKGGSGLSVMAALRGSSGIAPSSQMTQSPGRNSNLPTWNSSATCATAISSGKFFSRNIIVHAPNKCYPSFSTGALLVAHIAGMSVNTLHITKNFLLDFPRIFNIFLVLLFFYH